MRYAAGMFQRVAWSASSLLLLAIAGVAQSQCNAVRQLASRMQNALGRQEWIAVADDPSLEPQRLTLEAWVTPMGLGSGGASDSLGAVLAGKPRQGASGSWLGSYFLDWSSGTNQAVGAVVHQYAQSGTLATSEASILPGTTAHLALTFDGSELRLFVNGVLDVEVAATSSSIYYGAEQVLIGAANLGSGFVRGFDGVVDEVRIWDHARSPAEIVSTMHCRLTGSEAGLAGYWSLDGSYADASVHGNHGVPVGAPGFVSESMHLAFCSGCPTLSADRAVLSLRTGGVQSLTLDGTSQLAHQGYLLFGSLSGSFPGMTFAGWTIPLNPDGYTIHTLTSPSTPPLLQSAGILSAQGIAQASVVFPPGLLALDGLVLTHAYVVLAPPGLAGVSNPVPLTLSR